MPHGFEIERKFLVQPDWLPTTPGVPIEQGYLSSRPECVVRVRRAGDAAFLTIKGRVEGLVRRELEYPIPSADVPALLALCAQPPIVKTRHKLPFGGHTWEVDIFAGANAGLVMAEVELESADVEPPLPSWIGKEVSDDHRYFNSWLAEHPFSSWSD